VETVSFFPSLIKMIFSLALVLGLMIGAMYLTRKILHATTPAMDRGSLIRILASRYMGPKSSILVVDIAGEIIAVGISNSQITMLTKISDREALDTLRNLKIHEEPPSFPGTRQFARYKKIIASAMDDIRR
jgi:flagellar protein FliO/FliZ